jgi:hypothetical protein
VPTPLRRNRDFVLLQLGQVFSNLGTTMHPTVLPFRTPDGTMAAGAGLMMTVEANGVTLGVRHLRGRRIWAVRIQLR